MTYFVDSVAGSDSAAGTTITAPWKTLTNVNAHVFVPGERVAFKTGSVFANANLKLQGSGSSAMPDEATCYDASGNFGTAATGALPQFTGDPTYVPMSHTHDNVTVILYNIEYWTVDCLDVSGGMFAGVGVWATDLTTDKIYHSITLANLNIHDTSSNASQNWRAPGIEVTNEGYGNPTATPVRTAAQKFDGLTIQNCTIKNTMSRGIYVTSTQNILAHPSIDSKNYDTNVKIINNRISLTATDGISVNGCEDFLIQANRVDQAGNFQPTDTTKGNFNGMFWGDCLGIAGCVVENNTVTNTAKHPLTDTNGHFTDNMAFDLDVGNAGKHILQYNLSYHNAGGFCEVLKGSLPDALAAAPYNITDQFIARLNISHHDDLNARASDPVYTALIRGNGRHQEFYRNTFYCGTGPAIVSRSLDHGEDLPLTDHKFVDNIFYDPAGFYSGTFHGGVFAGNSSNPFIFDYNGFSLALVTSGPDYVPNNTNAKVGDPLFRNESNPGSNATDLQLMTTTPFWSAGTNTGIPNANPSPQNDYFVYTYSLGLTLGADVFEDTMRYTFNASNLTDISGHGYNGTPVGTVNFGSSTEAHSGSSCLKLAGTGYVSAGTPTFGNELGIDLWVFPTGSGTARILTEKCSTGSSSDGFSLGLSTTNQVQFSVGAASVTSLTTLLAVNAWSHVEATYAKSGQIAVYVNGVSANSVAAGSAAVPNNGSLQVRLGADQSGGSLFVGRMDEVKIRNDSAWRQ